MISSEIMDGRFFIILVFSLALNCLARPEDECSMTQQLYLHTFPNGTTRCCLWVECEPGSEVVICEKPYSADQCHPCIPPFIQPDKTNSELGTTCYKITCPEFSRLDENWKCICDTDMGYYGEFYYDCKYKKCSEGEKLTVWGICVDYKKFDLIPVKTTVPESKPKSNNTRDMTNLKPVKTSEDKKKADSKDNNSTSSFGNKSSGNFENKEEDNERPTKLLVVDKVDFHPQSFLYGCLTISPFLIFPGILIYYMCIIRKKQKNALNCILKTPAVNVTTGREVESNPNKNQTWKPVPAGSLPLWFKFPGRCQFNKPPCFKPTQYAVLPHKFKVGESIGILDDGKDPWGTGFVVGDGHVMTCLHTIIFMLGIRAETEDGIQQEINQHIHKVRISFHFNLASSKNDDTCFGFEQCEMYFDVNLDVIVLKIDRHCSNYQYLPSSLTRFCDLLPSSQFDFFGHPLGDKKQVDENCRIMTLSDGMIEEKIYRVAQYLIGRGFNLNDFPEPYYGIQNNGHYLFKTQFVVGGSGSPGITFSEMHNPDDQTYAVGTMLCGEYPNFGSNNIPREDLSPDLKIQFGTKMSSIFNNMKQKNPHLLEVVFQDYPPQWNQ
ncbi:hypothetical protein ACJMK2_020940 [Sinanodonta woodiana]|uniref:Uncharacterized protein n=1 Tax=Sinanodonta woodiana TaxID=1069815 RepID=A0ABD3U1S8_SINWO